MTTVKIIRRMASITNKPWGFPTDVIDILEQDSTYYNHLLPYRAQSLILNPHV